MPIFLDPVARRRTERDRRVQRRRRIALLILIVVVLAVLAAAIGGGDGSPDVQPPYEIPAAVAAGTVAARSRPPIASGPFRGSR